MHGKGVFEWNNGNSYEGEYENDVRYGHGCMKWANSNLEL